MVRSIDDLEMMTVHPSVHPIIISSCSGGGGGGGGGGSRGVAIFQTGCASCSGGA
jgi:hypothetical protein